MRLERFRFRAMGSPCDLQLWSESRTSATEIARACGDEIDRLERKYSRYRNDSLASQINRSAGNEAGYEVDIETGALLDFAAAAHRESEGRFDPTSGVLRRVWDFKSGRLPDADALAETRRLVGWSKLRWESPRLILPIAGMELDFGGFVKEYAADRVAELCRDRGITSGLVSLGGDLAVVGPLPDGESWRIGIRDPRQPNRAIARIALDSGGLATSGDYERFMIVDGERYSHLLDPRSGETHRGGPACVSVTAPHCLVAGITSTIAMLHDESEAGRFLRDVGLCHLMVSQSGDVSGTARMVDARGSSIDREWEHPPLRPSKGEPRLRTA
jgi:thiamine biosynthesis lipoprotein